MMHSDRAIASAVLLLLGLVSGCNKADSTATLPQTFRIQRAEDRWKAARLRDYDFYSSAYCECIPGYGSQKFVTVRAGRVTSVVDVRSGASVPLDWRMPVDSLFVLLRREAVDLPSWLDITFDPKLGYPLRAAFGRREVDGGAVIVIDSLRALQ